MRKNIILLTFIKILSSLIGFLMIPIILNYLDSSKYGIWLILSSIFASISQLDFGVGNSTRNILGEAWSKKNYFSSKKIVSSSFALIIVIVALINSLFWIANPFLDWIKILNIDSSLLEEVKTLIYLVFILISIKMITERILTVLYVDHRPVTADFIVLLSSLFSFVIIFIISFATKNSLIYVGLGLTFFSALLSFLASIWFFRFDYKLISPSFKYIDISIVKKLLKQGFYFSVLQISALVLTMTDMLIISNLYGPAEVVPYSIAFKLFSYITVLFGVIVAPLWAKYNEAFYQENFIWIKQVTRKLLYVWIFISVGVIILILSSKLIYMFWVGEKVNVPYALTISMGIFAIIQIFNVIFTTFIYSTGKLRVLTIVGVLNGLINIPLCYLMAENFNLGLTGIILSTVICTTLNAIIAFVQYKKIIIKNDQGIWSK